MKANATKEFLGSWTASLLGSIAVILFLVWLIYIQKPAAQSSIPDFIHFLPTSNAIANALSACFLIRAVIWIKRRDREAHKRNIFRAVFFSTLFLVGYIAFYTYAGDRKFVAESTLRGFYLILLASHILVSIISLPAILYSLSLGLQNKWPQHRKWAKKAFPMWLYVNVTGVLIYIIFSVFSEV